MVETALRAALEQIERLTDGRATHWRAMETAVHDVAVQALADTQDGAVDLDAAAQRAVHLLANYLWNEDGENEEWLIEAHDALAASLARASPPPQDPT